MCVCVFVYLCVCVYVYLVMYGWISKGERLGEGGGGGQHVFVTHRECMRV